MSKIFSRMYIFSLNMKHWFRQVSTINFLAWNPFFVFSWPGQWARWLIPSNEWEKFFRLKNCFSEQVQRVFWVIASFRKVQNIFLFKKLVVWGVSIKHFLGRNLFSFGWAGWLDQVIGSFKQVRKVFCLKTCLFGQM